MVNKYFNINLLRNWIVFYFLYSKHMTVKQIFGINLHSYRKLRGFSQEQLAEKLDISVKHLSTLETGKVFASAELIEKISAELNVSISALFYTSDEKSLDNSDISQINLILEEELLNTLGRMKNRVKTFKNL